MKSASEMRAIMPDEIEGKKNFRQTLNNIEQKIETAAKANQDCIYIILNNCTSTNRIISILKEQGYDVKYALSTVGFNRNQYVVRW